MTSKELVEICNTRSKCDECYYQSACLEYQNQFGCYPFDLVKILRGVPEAYSDTIIHFRKGLDNDK